MFSTISQAEIAIVAIFSFIVCKSSKFVQVQHSIVGCRIELERCLFQVGNEKTSRFGSRVPDAGLRKVYQVLHFLMPGTAIVYYGDEIAMTNGSVPNSKTVDPAAKHGLVSKKVLDRCFTPCKLLYYLLSQVKTLSQMTDFKHFQTERVCRRQFQI